MLEEEKDSLYLESPLEVVRYFDTMGKTIEFFEYMFEECATLIKANASDRSFIPPITHFEKSKTYNIDERFMSTMVVAFLQNSYQTDPSSLARLVSYFGSEAAKDRVLIKRFLYVSVFGDFLGLTPYTFRSDTTAGCFKSGGKNKVVLTMSNYYSVISNGENAVSVLPIPIQSEPLERYSSNFKGVVENYKVVKNATNAMKTIAFGYRNVEDYWARPDVGIRTESFTFNLN